MAKLADPWEKSSSMAHRFEFLPSIHTVRVNSRFSSVIPEPRIIQFSFTGIDPITLSVETG